MKTAARAASDAWLHEKAQPRPAGAGGHRRTRPLHRRGAGLLVSATAPFPARTCPRRNGWSRTSCRSTHTPAPARRSRRSDGVVVHHVGNPGTSAAANRSFFANLAVTHETYASALRRGAGGARSFNASRSRRSPTALAGERSHRFHRGLPRGRGGRVLRRDDGELPAADGVAVRGIRSRSPPTSSATTT